MSPDTEVQSFQFGSQDSIDEDRVYVFSSLPSLEHCQNFCKQTDENRNIIVIQDGVVSDCYKGCPDEMNNALFETYQLHSQAFPNPIKQRVIRNIPLKIVRITRILLSLLTKSVYRTDIKSALRSYDQNKRIMMLKQIDFGALGTEIADVETRKSLAFQLGQGLALLQGQECYTKSDIASFCPELSPFLAREESDCSLLNDLRDQLVQALAEVYVRTNGTLNLFCYISSVKVREWTPYNMQCRGTIVDLKKERCLAFPYEKFFKLGEIKGWRREDLGTTEPNEIVEKMDGSFVSAYQYEGQIAFACKGNFDAEQSQKATKIAEQYSCENLDFERYHFTFEVIYPQNRFPTGFSIVDYGKEEQLVLTGVRERHTQRMLDYREMQKVAEESGFPVPQAFSLCMEEVHQKIQEPIWDNFEGYVANFGGKRVKIKTTGYNQINKIANDIKHGSHRILKLYLKLSSEEWEDHLAILPTSFRAAVDAEVNLFKTRYQEWEDRLQQVLEEKGQKEAKAFIEYVFASIHQSFQKPLLRMFQGKNYQITLEALILEMLLEEGKNKQAASWSLWSKEAT